MAEQAKELTFLRDVITALEEIPSPIEHDRDRIDRLIEEYSIHAFKGVLCVLDLDGKIRDANHHIYLLTDWNEENNLQEGVQKNIIDFVPERYKKSVRQLFERLYVRRNNRDPVEIKFPLSIGRYEAKLPATLILQKKHILMTIEETHLFDSAEIELVRLKALIRMNPHRGLWVTDEDGVIQDVVHANLFANLGRSAEEVIGKNINDFMRGQDRRKDRVQKKYTLVRQTKLGREIETDVVRGDVRLQDGTHCKIYLDHYIQ